MKKLISGIFLIVTIAYVQAQTPNAQFFGFKLNTLYTCSFEQGYVDIEFLSGNRIKMWDLVDEYGDITQKNEKSGTYIINNANGIEFITISWNTGKQEKLLFLTNNGADLDGNNLFLYKSDSSPYYGAPTRDFAVIRDIKFGDSSWIKASSSFQETIGGKTVTYTPDKLGEKIGECWVPQKTLNEKLKLSGYVPVRKGFSIDCFYISCGFVSFSKPYLYKENARPKKIRLTSNSGESKIIELADTPHFQPLPKDMFYLNEVTIEILEVYPGTKYQDLCINAICYCYQSP